MPASLRSSVLLICIFTMQPHGRSQSPDAPAFAVATIKPGKHITQNAQRPYAGGYSAKDATLKDLISYAYNLPFGADGLISGGPKWAYTDTFDIEAKAEDAIEARPKANLTSADISNSDRLMLQRLLESRFKVRIHHEARQVEGFALTIASSGPKLTHSSGVPSPADSTRTYAFGAYLPTPPAGRQGMRLTRGDIHAPQATMRWLAGYLQFQPETEGHTVVDKTGLVGEFDLSLKWSAEGIQASSSPKENSEVPDLFTALQQQLGLKLQRIKVIADSIVIDNVEKPSAN